MSKRNNDFYEFIFWGIVGIIGLIIITIVNFIGFYTLAIISFLFIIFAFYILNIYFIPLVDNNKLSMFSIFLLGVLFLFTFLSSWLFIFDIMRDREIPLKELIIQNFEEHISVWRKWRLFIK